MCSESDKDYMRVAMNIEGSIHHTYEFSDETIKRATESQVQKNLEARKPMRNYLPIDHMAATDEPVYSDSAEDYKALDEAVIPYRDLIRNNPKDWDEFVESHLSAYPDFKQWVYNFQHKGQAPLESLKRIIERAIKDIE